MPVVKNVQLFWVKLNPTAPTRFQNNDTAAATWNFQFRIADKKVAEGLTKEYGFRFTPVEDDGKIVYRSSVSKYAYARGADNHEDTNNPNIPVDVIGADGRKIDPDTVGNGSIGNFSFTQSKSGSRTLRALQVTKWKVFTPRTSTSDFDIVDPDEFEIVEAADTAEASEDDVDTLF